MNKNPDINDFEDMIALRDECLKKSIEASLYKEYCEDHPWIPAQDAIDMYGIDSGLVTQQFVDEMYKRTVDVCSRDEIAYENAAHQIEDQAFIKLTAKFIENGDLSISSKQNTN